MPLIFERKEQWDNGFVHILSHLNLIAFQGENIYSQFFLIKKFRLTEDSFMKN